MTTTTVQPPAPAVTPGAVTRARDLLGSEWIKLRSVRSTYLTMAAAAVASIGIGAVSSAMVSGYATTPPQVRAQFDSFARTLSGLVFAQLAFGMLGALAISSEYGTGMIRTSLTAVPHRRSVLAAKAAVLAIIVTPLALVVSFASFLLGQGMLHSQGVSATLATPGALTAVLGGAGSLIAATLLGLGLGAVIRHSAGAITAVTGMVLLLPLALGEFPPPWNVRLERLMPYLNPIIARHVPAPGDFTPGIALLVTAVWAAAAVAAGLFLITRRDA
jgi:hypothetical protein